MDTGHFLFIFHFNTRCEVFSDDLSVLAQISNSMTIIPAVCKSQLTGMVLGVPCCSRKETQIVSNEHEQIE